MPLPEAVRLQAELLLLAYCQARTPPSIRHALRLAFRTRLNTMTLYVSYGPWKPKFPKNSRTPVAQFRYDPEQRSWTLYRADEKEKWHLYDKVPPTPGLLTLIQEVDADPSKVFFG
jgi:hypothetical protein